MRRYSRSLTDRTAVALLRALLAAVIALGCGDESVPAPDAPSDGALPAQAFRASPDPVLAAIERLESDHDATCHSSASRLEDFLFGTPLSVDARQANVELQKRLVRSLWSRASINAVAAGSATVTQAHLGPRLAELAVLERGVDGALRVATPGAPAVDVPAQRAAQYASIAYSLRAILGVQQDFAVAGGTPLAALEPASVDVLRETLDGLALAALLAADRTARATHAREIDAPTLRAAWTQLVPELAATSGEVAASDSGLVAAPPAADARASALALLDRVVEGKRQAYRSYNELGEEDETIKLLVFNINRFYARRPLSRYRAVRRQFVAAFEARLDAFAADLLQQADRRAEAARVLLRADDARAAVQHRIPHRIDEFEDLHVFERLPPTERVTLESFDCDSLRDFGLHWSSLQRAAHAAPQAARLPDPFAAEILAEAISQYGILLLRVAGVVAGLDTDHARLLEPDLATAAAMIRERAARHHAAPEPPVRTARIHSSPPVAGAVAEGSTFFRDVTEAAGVAFEHRSSRWLGEFRHKQMKTPPTFSGGGVAAEDIDGDGDVDLLFVGGVGNALLENDGHGHFANVTAEAGLDSRRDDGSHGEPRTPLIADFDNDGRQDILITYVDDPHRLYRNTGDGFEDVSSGSGLGGAGLVGGPATVFDFDGDGLLDVYLAYFGDYLHGAVPTVDRDNRGALPNRLFRNLGDLRFEDVTKNSGTADTGWTQAVSHVDFDRDGRQDLIVANDYGSNAFLRNLGAGQFEDVAPALGVTRTFHSMNVGVADLNDDDHPDVYISNLATLVKNDKYTFPDVNTPLHFDLRAMAGMMIKESDILWMSQLDDGHLSAFVPSGDVERGETSTGWAWDAEFLDFDHDGDDDLYLVNGTNDFHTFAMVYRRFYDDGTSAEAVIDHRRESNVFFRNEGGKLRNVSARSGANFAANSRSTAYLDYDGDGDLDIAVNSFHAPARLLRNDAEKGGGWLKLQLVGDPARRSNRDAIGAQIVLTTDTGARVRRWVQGGSGYLSMNPKQQHFGLGQARSAEARITWPNGEVQALRDLVPGRAYRVRQGAAKAEATED